MKHLIIDECVSIAAPITRMVVVWACYDPKLYADKEDRTLHGIEPVLAIQAKIVNEYERVFFPDGDDPCREIATHEEAVHAGYKLNSRGLVYDCIVAASFVGCLSTASEAFGDPAGYHEGFSCDWPKEEDETRLADEVLRIRKFVKDLGEKYPRPENTKRDRP